MSSKILTTGQFFVDGKEFGPIQDVRIEFAPAFPKVLPVDFKPHWRDDLSNEAYHAMSDFVSSTGVRSALGSMAKCKTYFSGGAKEPTEAMIFGTLAHACVLENTKFF